MPAFRSVVPILRVSREEFLYELQKGTHTMLKAAGSV
jgi:hypothetical protein